MHYLSSDLADLTDYFFRVISVTCLPAGRLDDKTFQVIVVFVDPSNIFVIELRGFDELVYASNDLFV